jgi:diguanylate cyclase (GGDEF)-like protein
LPASGDRDYDLIGRFGGEELCVLLPHTTAPEARQTAERLRGKLAPLIVPAGPGPDPVPLRVTVPIGVAMLESGRRDLDELIAARSATPGNPAVTVSVSPPKTAPERQED